MGTDATVPGAAIADLLSHDVRGLGAPHHRRSQQPVFLGLGDVVRLYQSSLARAASFEERPSPDSSRDAWAHETTFDWLADPTLDVIITHTIDTDAVAHRRGVGHPEYVEKFRETDRFLEGLAGRLGAQDSLLILGDHGHDARGYHSTGIPSTTVYFAWGTTTSYGNTVGQAAVGSGTDPIAVNAPIASLLPGTTYHYALIASNSMGVVTSADATFTTPALAPLATTLAASGIASASATLNATVTPNGAATTVYFLWGTNTSTPGTFTWKLPLPVSIEPAAISVLLLETAL